MKRSKTAFLVALCLLVLAGFAWFFTAKHESEPKPKLGLMTSLPVYWGETGEFGDLLTREPTTHWVKTALEREFELVPLDILEVQNAAGARAQLGSLKNLALLQPRPLGPAEYVALDTWVADGGHLLLFADPLLTEHSQFGLGDKRRPQDIALLSPIFSRWGLAQYFDETQPTGLRNVEFGAAIIPVEQFGYFEITSADTSRADCRLHAKALIADCLVGKGRVVIVADAALLDGESASRANDRALQMLVERAFDAK